LELYPHQRDALKKLSNGKILWGGVGSGKTKVAAKYYEENEAPKDVYVITTAKKRDSFDWQEEFYQLGVGPRTGPSGILGKSRSSTGEGQSRGKRTRTESAARALRGESDPPTQTAGLEVASFTSQDPARGSDGNHLVERSGDRGAHLQGDDSGGVSAGFLHSRDSGRADRGQGESQREMDHGGAFPWVLTVDSWNNIAKYADVAGAFFIFDEQRLVGSGDWARKFLRIAKHNNWILLTATPGDTWMDYIPVFVANNFYKNRTAFKREHVVYNTFTKFPKVDRYIGVGKLLKHRRDLLVEMPFERHTKRRIVEVPLRYNKEALDMVLKKRWNIYENRPLRDVAEMFLVGRRLVNSDPSRLEMVYELWQKHPKLIIFYNFNFELEALRRMIDYFSPSPDGSTSTSMSNSKLGMSQSGEKSSSEMTTSTSTQKWKASETTVEVAEWNGHKHQPIPTTDRWLYLVQYTAGAEGWNCIETNASVMYSRHYSWKVTEQARGRIDRMNTPFETLYYYDFTSESFIDRAIGRSLRAKKNFNEAAYKSLFES
jgi:hypothetical protein